MGPSYDIIDRGNYYDLKTTRYYNNTYVIHRYYHYAPQPKLFMPVVHPKHRKTPLIPQPGLTGNVNRTKSKRKRK